MTRGIFVKGGSLLLWLFVWALWLQPVEAKVDVMPGSAIEADAKAVSELVAAFDRAEAAIQTRDLDALMTFYSKSYNYHKLRKSDVRRIWEELFEYHRQLKSRHLFTEVKTVATETGVRAEIKCTGALWGVNTETGQKVTLDSWFEEVHYLAKEDGAWRLIGNAGEGPETHRFGHAPHPLF